MAIKSAPVPFPRREATAHKTSVGTVLVVAGSRGMSGAAFLTGEGALRTGAGLVTIACPEGVNDVLEVKTTCVMTRPVPETEEGSLAEEALDDLRELARSRSAVAMGPGLTRHPEAEAVVRELAADLARGGPPLVLDADGLNAFEERAGELSALAGRAVLTPHPGELARLIGCPTSALKGEEARRRRLEAFVRRTGVTTLLKGHGTLVATPGRPTWRNETGNPGMATGGTGDVLTGVVAALLAAGLPPHDAARLGAYVHGKAGDVAARTRGWAGLIATDLLDALPAAIAGEELR